LRDVIIKPEREEFVSPMALRGRWSSFEWCINHARKGGVYITHGAPKWM
jgi:hypothetical protein